MEIEYWDLSEMGIPGEAVPEAVRLAKAVVQNVAGGPHYANYVIDQVMEFREFFRFYRTRPRLPYVKTRSRHFRNEIDEDDWQDLFEPVIDEILPFVDRLPREENFSFEPVDSAKWLKEGF